MPYRCPVCKNPLVDFKYSKNYLWCNQCDLLVSTVEPQKYESDYYFFHKKNKGRLNKLYNVLKHYNLIKKRILDFGCGKGEFMELIIQRHLEIKIFGYEISKYAVKYARNKNLKIFATMEEILNSGEKFDLILMLDVIEHIDNPVPVLKTLYNLLETNGKIFITTPNKNSRYAIYGKENWHGYFIPQFHRLIFSTKSLVKLMEKANFYPETIYTTPPFSENFFKKIKLLMASFVKAEKNKFKKIAKGLAKLPSFLKLYFNDYLENDTIVGIFGKTKEGIRV